MRLPKIQVLTIDDFVSAQDARVARGGGGVRGVGGGLERGRQGTERHDHRLSGRPRRWPHRWRGQGHLRAATVRVLKNTEIVNAVNVLHCRIPLRLRTGVLANAA